MFEVTEKAVEIIKKAFADQEKIPSIRVVLNEGGYQGPPWAWFWMNRAMMIRFLLRTE